MSPGLGWTPGDWRGLQGTRGQRIRRRIELRLRDLWIQEDRFLVARSPVYGETGIEIQFRTEDLLWRPVGRLVRFVWARHPVRGRLLLMTTDLARDPLKVIAFYGYRFKIEVAFKQALHTVGVYAYHFWMMAMKPRRRRSGNQHLHRDSDECRRLVRRKMAAYHRSIQLGCIAQGLWQHLSCQHRKIVWGHFRSWMRTMNPAASPSEAVVAEALRSSLPEFLLHARGSHELAKFISANADPDRHVGIQSTG